MELTGSVESIIFRNAENGYSVLEFLTDSMERITVVGSLALCNRGERATLTGNFTSHPKYGRQFHADSCEIIAPATISAIEAYLGNGMIKGVGEAMARAIVQRFGMETLNVLENEPERLMEISGIGQKKCRMISDSFRENRETREIMLALEPYGVTVGQAMKLYRIYGDLCLAKIQSNPYRMIEDVEGIGFITADRIARNIPEFSENSRVRLCAGIQYALNVARTESGHTFLPRTVLVEYAMKLLGADEISVSDALDELLRKEELGFGVINDQDAIFFPWLGRTEQLIAEKLLILSEKPVLNPFLKLTYEQTDFGVELAEQQRNAVLAALEEGLLVITGGPGTGKTTIIRCVTDVLERMQMDFVLCAPTGRAAKRMTEATGVEAKTIHRLLEYVPGEGFTRDEDSPLECDMVIMDEVSMVDVPLMHAFLKAVRPGTRLVLVGDADQLPPVGCGDVLSDIIRSGSFRTIRLNEIFRQSGGYIIKNAYAINHGKMPDLNHPESDFRFEQMESPDQVLERVVWLCSHPERILKTKEPLMDVQVLVPMKKGTLGVNNLNRELQKALNPKAPGKREQSFGETVFREGDKVMQIQNDYRIEWTRKEKDGSVTEGAGVFNGDLGTVFRVEPEVSEITVLFDDNRLAVYDCERMEMLTLAYCISVHKSQGSEFPTVILPLCGGVPMLLTRNLLYTAVTRAKKQVCCIGRAETIHTMVENNRDTRRYTALCQRIRETVFLQGGRQE